MNINSDKIAINGHNHTSKGILDIQILQNGDHLCCLYSSDEEGRKVLGAFLKSGVEKYDKIIYIAEVLSPDLFLSDLSIEGIDLNMCIESGQFQILAPDTSYLRDGIFDPDRIIALLKSETAIAVSEGYNALRVVCEMSSVMNVCTDSQQLIEYETKLNESLKGFDCLGICMYDLRVFPANITLNILRTHPTCVIDGRAHNNFYYIPSGGMHSANREAVELRNWMDNLRKFSSESDDSHKSRKLYETAFDLSLAIKRVTGVTEIDTCLKNGAHDNLLKPIESERLIASLANALRMVELEDDYTRLAESMLSDTLHKPAAFAHICSQSESLLRLFKYVESVGATSHPVLITGETGVGKELFAQSIHAVSGRVGDCVCVNIAGLDDAMFSDTLFGHVKGAFTGADSFRPGLIQSAAGGTIFLDEIGDLSVQSQVKLLRLIQEKEYRQLGSDVVKPCQARIVAATCRTLSELNASEHFRKDLYYRLRTHHIHVPPLRERKEDLPLLVEHFVKKAALELDQNVPYVPSDLFPLLNAYHFPGNVRELEAMIFDAISNTRNGKMSLKSMHAIVGVQKQSDRPVSGVTFHTQLPTLKEVEHLLIVEAYSRASGNQTVAAEILGITRQTLAYRLKQM